MPPAATRSAFARRLINGLRARAKSWPWRYKPALPETLRRQLCADTQNVCSTLLQFGKSSDNEFTALAQGLSKLNQNLSQLRTQNADFLLIIEDRDDDRPIASAHEVYKRSVDLVHSSIGIAVSEQEQMRGIESILLSACGASAHFEKNQLILRMITMSIRMEAARLPAEDQALFLTIADAISHISQEIATSTETAFQRIRSVISETCAERTQLQAIEHDLHERAKSSIRTIQHELHSLQSALSPCAEQCRHLTTLLADTQPLTFRTISSLQHQDIVRQQLEHVSSGFQDLQKHLRASPLEPGYIHHAADIQQAHLHSARLEIQNATSDVVAGLQAMLDASTNLVDRFTAIESTGSAAFADFRIVSLFREEIGQLARVADKCKETNRNISHLVDRIEEVVRLFAVEIGHHELDVKIVALNAQIAAARVPSADALDRLAEEASRVSNNNTAVTRQLLDNLKDGLTQLLSIKASADEFLTIITEEKAALENGVAIVTEKLTRLGTRVQAAIAQVKKNFEAAQDNTRNLLAQLKLPALIQDSFPPAEKLCTQLLAATSTHAGRHPLTTQAAAQLEAHRDRYTMQKENLTHSAALATPSRPKAEPPSPHSPPNPTPTPPPSPSPAPASPSSEKFSDGIELF